MLENDDARNKCLEVVEEAEAIVNQRVGVVIIHQKVTLLL